MEQTTRFADLKQVAKIYQYNHITLRRLAIAGRLPGAFKCGKNGNSGAQWRVDLEILFKEWGAK